MNYRFMRTILFFDLPSITSSDKKNYRNFIKLIKSNGFYMIQESVYVKMSIDMQKINSTLAIIKSSLPPKGNIIVLNITEKQFASMDILLGDIDSDFISNDERFIVI